MKLSKKNQGELDKFSSCQDKYLVGKRLVLAEISGGADGEALIKATQTKSAKR